MPLKIGDKIHNIADRVMPYDFFRENLVEILTDAAEEGSGDRAFGRQMEKTENLLRALFNLTPPIDSSDNAAKFFIDILETSYGNDDKGSIPYTVFLSLTRCLYLEFENFAERVRAHYRENGNGYLFKSSVSDENFGLHAIERAMGRIAESMVNETVVHDAEYAEIRQDMMPFLAMLEAEVVVAHDWLVVDDVVRKLMGKLLSLKQAGTSREFLTIQFVLLELLKARRVEGEGVGPGGFGDDLLRVFRGLDYRFQKTVPAIFS